MNRLFLWAITSALAGFIFGFDLIVISGAEKRIQDLWELSDKQHGFAISSALWGTVIGALFGSIPTDRYGRKKTLIAIGILYFVSAIGSAIANDYITFSIARAVGGFGVGISTIAAPLFISEISPAHRRGRLTGLFQFNIVLGILMAYLSNTIIGRVFPEETAWRWMMGIEALPALIYTLMCFTLPESPRWLIANKNRFEEGKAVLQQTMFGQPQEAVDKQAEEIRDSVSISKLDASSGISKLAFPIAIAFLVSFFNQLSGINAIITFAPRIFEMTGLGAESALLQSIGIGVTNLIFTYLGLWLIDKIGRRMLLIIGSFGYIITLGATAWAFKSGNMAIVPVCIFGFIGAHAIGQGTVIWVLISEIFPARSRALGQMIGSATHWVFAAITVLAFPYFKTNTKPEYIFGFFCFMMVLHLFWALFMVPETKGRSLEDIR